MLPTRLPRCAPEDVGVSPDGLARFLEELSTQRDPHSLVLLRHGQVICEVAWAPYRLDEPHTLFSLSKSFASTAIGIAAAEGLLTIDDLVLEHFASDAPTDINPEQQARLERLRIRHLLTMTSGHENDATPRYSDTNWARAFLGKPLDHEPGTVFTYNSGCTYMLSALVQKLCGHTLLNYLRPRLFDPLGIQNVTWMANSEGVNVGGWGMRCTTQDVATFGQLYFQKGRWADRQLVPESWIHDATQPQANNSKRSIDADWRLGYGYQFWRSQHGAYRGDGAFGQYCVVMPEHDAVLAINSGVGPMQPTLDIVWEYLLPALRGEHRARSTQVERQTVASPSLASASHIAGSHIMGSQIVGSLTSASLADVSGSREISLVDRKPVHAGFSAAVSASLDANSEGYVRINVEGTPVSTAVTFAGQDGDEVSLIVGHSEWIDQTTRFTSFDGSAMHVRTKGFWTDAETLCARMVYVGEPFTFDFELSVAERRVCLHGSYNVAFGDDLPLTRYEQSRDS